MVFSSLFLNEWLSFFTRANRYAKLPEVIATLPEAVKVGELGKALLAAKKERVAVMRKRRGRPNFFTGGRNGMIKFHSSSFRSLA